MSEFSEGKINAGLCQTLQHVLFSYMGSPVFSVIDLWPSVHRSSLGAAIPLGPALAFLILPNNIQMQISNQGWR